MENIKLFKGIKEVGLDALLGYLQAKPYVFKKDKIIYKKGDKITDIAIVLVGEIKLSTQNIDGSENIIGYARDGETFCTNYAMREEKTSQINATATKQTGVLFLPYERIVKFNENIPTAQTQIIKNLLEITAKENIELKQKTIFLEKKSIQEKVLAYLNNEATIASSDRFEIELSREDMAEYLGVDRSALSRELSNMSKKGLIQYKKNEFTLLKTNA